MTDNQRVVLAFIGLSVLAIWVADALKFRLWRDRFRANLAFMPKRATLEAQEWNVPEGFVLNA